MTSTLAVEFRGSKPTAESTFLTVLPVELRLKIYEFLYDDLINELSDNLFGVFWLYDSLYDYTRSSLESHVGKTGLTTLLYTCKQVHNEALQILCNEAEFIVNIMGDDDGDDEERAEFRFSKNSRLLEFAKNLKVNLEPLSDETNERFVKRIRRFLEAINHGMNLRSLKIRISGPKLENPQSLSYIFLALSTLKTAGNLIEVYLGEVTEDVLGPNRLGTFIGTINGVDKGGGHHVLEPSHYDDEEDGDY
ncbi:hypothetical protein GQX73_g4014 [Xylaria multiplex]|uniref:F-box domain-containing protein n=1 Tax=Xylaria multiplex TaxID=323545 RepID=A0A7C8MZP4_9PEZI|nr:hypothetical protein GQX73_g4014 [Xylaria multiplex]